MTEILIHGSLITRRSLQEVAGAPDQTSAGPAITGLHTQFGADATRQVTVSWYALQQVSEPRVLIARDGSRYERSVSAIERTYTDAKSGRPVYAYHASISGLRANTSYIYAAIQDGAKPELGSFRTAPRGRAPFIFTSFGDQGTPAAVNSFGSPASAWTTSGVDRIDPLFHLFNGDLCYANLTEDRVQTWEDFWDNNTRSARHRPWMPAAGNHENELGNGPIGYSAYQTYFEVPEQEGQTETTRGLWYSFTVGAVRIISLANDDICYQDGGNSYVRGYSGGAQKAWLERELKEARNDDEVDWIVVCMHQVAVSTADRANGADLGIRENWLPLFDEYGVDLVVCGHEHHYERSHPLRGRKSNATLTPVAADAATDVVDTTLGTVHMVLGGGGSVSPTFERFFTPPRCRVIVDAGAPDPITGTRPPIYRTESAPWLARRDPRSAYGLASFTVNPGTREGGITSIAVTYYEVTGPDGELQPFESFTLQRPRSDHQSAADRGQPAQEPASPVSYKSAARPTMSGSGRRTIDSSLSS